MDTTHIIQLWITNTLAVSVIFSVMLTLVLCMHNGSKEPNTENANQANQSSVTTQQRLSSALLGLVIFSIILVVALTLTYIF